MDFDKSGLVFESLLTRMEGSTLILTFNRPEKRNAINWAMEREFWTALEVAQQMDEVKAVILNGAGKMFSAGHDLKDSAPAPVGNGATVDGEMWARQSSMLASWNFHKPFIAAVHGFVGPYANGILLTADFIIAAEGTKFSWEHARTSVGRPWGPYPLMYFHFPPRVAYKLWLMGGWMDAEQALQLHYVQRVVEESQLEDVALQWAEQMSLIDTDGFQRTKKGVHEMIDAMGLTDMGVVAKKPMEMGGRRAAPQGPNFNDVWAEQGMQAALKLRDAGADPDITRV